MRVQSQQVVQKLWNYCNVLRDDGVSYSDYVEQLTYLLFIKMVHEQMTQSAQEETSRIPAEYAWESLLNCDDNNLVQHYQDILKTLSQQSGLLGIIFRNALNKIQHPAHLRRLINAFEREVWTGLDIDVKGDVYEGLLQKNAEDVKSGAGQYFTSRPLIWSIVDVMRPTPGMRICDPACGTGGFLLAAHEYIRRYFGHKLDDGQKCFLKEDAFRGWEIVDNTARLCMMNLFLHGIGSDDKEKLPIRVSDSLRSSPGDIFDMVLTNPPFGRKSSMAIVTRNSGNVKERESGSGVITRDNFWASTSNKQLNFVQHAYSLLRVGGRAAIVVPDNVLFEAGAGEVIRRKLLEECDVHTLLRLPAGIFYAQGVKANVLFFDKQPSIMKQLWVYDLRTNQNFTLRTNPLTRRHLNDFVVCYHAENRMQRQESQRFRVFSYDDLLKRDKLNLDFSWLQDKSLEEANDSLSPDVLISGVIEDLQVTIEQLILINEDLNNGNGTAVNGR